MHSFTITESSEVAHARRAVGALASTIGFTAAEAGRAALVTTEMCSNIVKHGGGGELLVKVVDDGSPGLELIGLDKGPGMIDVQKCLQDGFSTGGSPGTGLGAIGRLAQLFDLYSRAGKGTAVLAQLWPEAHVRHASELEIGAIVVPKPGETECGDAWCYVERGGGALVLGVDGLGHGLGAAQAAKTACQVFEAEKHRLPKAIFQQIHSALRSTRGAAVALLEIDWNKGQLLATSVGNLVVAIVTDAAVKRVAADNGIVGHATPAIRELPYPIEPAAALVMHSDGLGSGWQPERYPGLMRHHPAVIGGVLYRDCKRGRDDCLIVVIKQALQ